MPINYPGPYEVRIFYIATISSTTFPHVFRFSIDMDTPADPGDPFSDWSVALRNGATQPLDELVDDFLIVLSEVFATTTDFTRAELWEYEEGTFNAAFKSSYTLSVSGQNVAGTATDAQLIFGFRTTGGGFVKLDLRHTVHSELPTVFYPTGDANWDAIIDFCISNSTFLLGRDNTFAFSPYAVQSGRNERMARDRLR